MARPLRIQFPGALYHVTARGNAKQAIYRDNHDKAAFLNLLGGVTERYEWFCHCYCLMGNHYHLVVETPKANLSSGMRQLNSVYTQRFNQRHRRNGHLFQGRYHAVLVEKDSYLKELCRYILLNPVRAGLAHRPQNWHWSSYRGMVGQDTPPAWLYTDWLLSQFGPARKTAIENFEKFIREAPGIPEYPGRVKNQIYLGGKEFVKKMRAKVKEEADLSEIPRTQWDISEKPPLSAILKRSASDREAMARAFLEGGYQLKEIAAFFGVHYTTVSRAVKRWEEK